MQMPSDIGAFHIIGVGGIGMSAIAEILIAKGYLVQGSDQRENANVRRLREKGVRVFVGHDPVNLIGARNVVISSAVKSENPELQAAQERGLPIIRRAEILAELMRLYSTISVTGTHGKTSTTSLIAHIFTAAGFNPTVITGGIIKDWGSNARLGKSPWMIVEADESDGTFTRLPTQIGVVTNIDPEHLDYFLTVENMHRAYQAFYSNIPFYGLAVTCVDHPVVRSMIEKLNMRRDGRRLLTYGVSEDADLKVVGMGQDGDQAVFDAQLSERVAGGKRLVKDVPVSALGVHNALNTLAAFAVAKEAGLKDEEICAALASFSGVKRRFQKVGFWRGVSIYDDYAHHPVEIAAVLQAARARTSGRLTAVVEPHRYSRVKNLFEEFCNCFVAADRVVVGPLYTAGEKPIDGISSRALAEGIRQSGHPNVMVIDDPRALVPLIQRDGGEGDLVICLGAGESTEWAHGLPQWLEDNASRLAGE